ncbi:MAG: hypothetical protein KatS3mg129_1765 [Leptospiraceae bacterium]|nr:MAG: hypothetical protein KatS3mg129_1765 [Leptospiraceae bacterium]
MLVNYCTLNEIGAILLVFYINIIAEGKGYEIFFPAGMFSALLCSYVIGKLILKQPLTEKKIIIAGILVGTISHYFAWLFASFFMTLCYFIWDGCKSSLNEPPIFFWDMLYMGFLYSFTSLIFFGWFSVSWAIASGFLISIFFSE